MYKLICPFLFLMRAETAHHFTLRLLKIAYKLKIIGLFVPKLKNKEMNIFGIKFNNPVGLAAGLDKNGDYIDCLAALGFGFIEVGTITPRPQNGNEKPRLFRIMKAQALINRMGFNNKGVDYLVENLKRKKTKCIVGVNIGKNKSTSLDDAHNDYISCLEKIYLYADYVTINISSPNTPNLRKLQTSEYLYKFLSNIQAKNNELQRMYHKKLPLLLKLSPDVTKEELQEIVVTAKQLNITGIIVNNTTQDRPKMIQDFVYAQEAGGLSGKPISELSNKVLMELNKEINNSLPVISVGGIYSVEEAQKRFSNGAVLIQIYTALIYKGPGLLTK